MRDPGHSGPDVGSAFERLLCRALDSGRVREALGRSCGKLDRECLRKRALRERAAIAEAAAAEYREYVEAGGRQDARGDTGSPAVPGKRGGGWLMAALAFVAVVAVALLALGFAFRAFVGRPYVGDGVMTAGLIVGAVAAGAIVGDLVWSWKAPARTTAGEETAEDGWIQEEWELALLEWGLVPFLLDCIEEPGLLEQDNRSAR
ncbi:hypothetical protein [Streptomyces sp. MBT53]|uniref:hypothetical protein n=1 Tax=Streptomyces sp. MBT53 TaxID=1488384 RepID=UPI0019146954|nr:hypothetical protein [Streptomyces sp. MBT53]MBK6016057.1 hypothetical protein [Streptomyces sp. MBT53]